MGRWVKYSFFTLIVIIIIAVVLFFHYRHQPVKHPAFAGFPPAAVDIAKVKMQQWPQTVESTGTVEAQHGVLLSAQVAGEVLKVFVRSGQLIKAGDPIYQIDPQGMRQQLEQELATLKLKKEEYNESQTIFKKGYLSKDQRDRAYQAYQVALKTVDQVKKKLGLTTVTAPFSGQLGVLLVHKGDYVTVGQSVISLQDYDHLRVDFSIPGTFAGLVQAGQKVLFEFQSFPGQIFNGTVDAINSSIDPETRMLLIRAHLDKKNKVIFPGAFADVTLFLNEGKLLPTVPMTAIVYNSSGTYVYVVDKGVAHLTPVDVGMRRGLDVAIIKGLHSGESIVSVGKVKLMDGARVIQAKPEK